MDLTSFQLLTFDCYGTLIDWESGIAGALAPILARHRLGIDRDSLLSLYAELEHEAQGAWQPPDDGPGNAPDAGRDDWPGDTPRRPAFRPYRDVLGSIVDAMGERLGFTPTRADRDALAVSLPTWRPFPDTVAALNALRRHAKLAILSNIDNDLFEGTRQSLGVPMDFVVTAELCRSYKPAPAHFRAIAALSGLPPEQILHVAESRYHDVVPARALGFATVWVNRRAKSPDEPGGASEGDEALSPFDATPDLEVPDLATLAALVASAHRDKR